MDSQLTDTIQITLADAIHAGLLTTILWLLYGVIAFIMGWLALMKLIQRGTIEVITPEP